MCSTSCMGLKPEEVVHDRVITDEAYIPVPFLKTLNLSTRMGACISYFNYLCNAQANKNFDEDGYDVVPILMIATQQEEEPSHEEFYEPKNDILLGDMVSIRDVSALDYGTIDNGNEGDFYIVWKGMIQMML